MNRRVYGKQAGIVLLEVLAMLTLLGLVGITFTFFTPQIQCERNPTVELTDHRCTKQLANANRQTP